MDNRTVQLLVSEINRKRVPPNLKGKALHDFKNEFHTLSQLMLHIKDYDNPVDRRLALHWAAWGATRLKDYFGMNEEEKRKLDKQL